MLDNLQAHAEAISFPYQEHSLEEAVDAGHPAGSCCSGKPGTIVCEHRTKKQKMLVKVPGHAAPASLA